MTALEIQYRIRSAPVRPWPFDHIVVENALPGDVYRDIRANLPPIEVYKTLSDLGRVTPGAYPERHVFFLDPARLDRLSLIDQAKADFWAGVSEWLLSEEFLRAMIAPFAEALRRRFNGQVSLKAEACLMRDLPGYALGPHTDKRIKVVSALFYLPGGDDLEDGPIGHLGTSLYVPKDRAFTCAGGPHYPVDGFDKVTTIPFRPNTLFAFPKTERSFHGVERTARPRDLLLYDVFEAA